jgi:subtilisin-like proprotein convertase family protein
MRISTIGSVLLAAGALIACGPNSRDRGDDIAGDDTVGDDSTEPDASECVPSASTELSCNDGFDEDCDGFLDCEDVDCLNHTQEGCPSTNCGELTHPESTPLALPDDGTGSIPYETPIEITGFAAGQMLEDVTGILGVCVTMEHSWLRDLEISAFAPNGTQVILMMQLGNTGSEVYMGQANDADSSDAPVPGVGWEYCWTPTATTSPMLDYVNETCATGTCIHDLPAGDYQASSGFDPWLGTVLNGNWTIRVRDLWGIDNGFIFDWTIKFDPNLVEDCTEWPTE